jgi:hypothetical protein
MLVLTTFVVNTFIVKNRSSFLLRICGVAGVAGRGCTGRIGLFDKVVTVVCVDAGASSRRFIAAATERVTLEADGAADARQIDAGEAIFEVPRECTCPCRRDLRQRVPVPVVDDPHLRPSKWFL